MGVKRLELMLDDELLREFRRRRAKYRLDSMFRPHLEGVLESQRAAVQAVLDEASDRGLIEEIALGVRHA